MLNVDVYYNVVYSRKSHIHDFDATFNLYCEYHHSQVLLLVHYMTTGDNTVIIFHLAIAEDAVLGTELTLVLKLSFDAGLLTPVAREPCGALLTPLASEASGVLLRPAASEPKLLLVMLIIGVK